MKFELDGEEKDFAGARDSLLTNADTVAVARAWADGDSAPGLKLWARLAEQGVLSLATDATPVELCIAFEALGRYAVPGPWVESAAYLASRTGLQVHGAIGYTQEFDLSLWLTKIRALVTAWGTPDFHRARILQHLGAS